MIKLLILFIALAFCQCVVMSKAHYSEDIFVARYVGEIQGLQKARTLCTPELKPDESKSLLLGWIELDSMKLMQIGFNRGLIPCTIVDTIWRNPVILDTIRNEVCK